MNIAFKWIVFVENKIRQGGEGIPVGEVLKGVEDNFSYSKQDLPQLLSATHTSTGLPMNSNGKLLKIQVKIMWVLSANIVKSTVGKYSCKAET